MQEQHGTFHVAWLNQLKEPSTDNYRKVEQLLELLWPLDVPFDESNCWVDVYGARYLDWIETL